MVVCGCGQSSGQSIGLWGSVGMVRVGVCGGG